VKERFRLDNCELAKYLSGRLDIAARFRSSGSREDDKAGRRRLTLSDPC
jgi:hypothetical protein